MGKQEKDKDYVTVQIPTEMAESIEDLGWFKMAYESLDEFVTDATRHALERLLRRETHE